MKREDLAKEVREPFYMGTLWRVSEDHWRRIRRGITKWAGGHGTEISSPRRARPDQLKRKSEPFYSTTRTSESLNSDVARLSLLRNILLLG